MKTLVEHINESFEKVYKQFKEVREGDTIYFVDEKSGTVDAVKVTEITIDNFRESVNGGRTLTIRKGDEIFDTLHINKADVGTSEISTTDGKYITSTDVLGINYNFGKVWQ